MNPDGADILGKRAADNAVHATQVYSAKVLLIDITGSGRVHLAPRSLTESDYLT